MIRMYVRSLILAQSEDCAKYLEAILQVEMTPMTQNDNFLQAEMEKWVVKYKEQRVSIPTPTSNPARPSFRAPEPRNVSTEEPRRRPIRPIPQKARRDGPAAESTSAPCLFLRPVA